MFDIQPKEDFFHIQYVKEKLTEAEAVAGNPDEWISVDELFKQWDNWDTKK
ncbi:MAG: hypothetical protein FWG44_04100 [Oscillospiraceae bacterium]|nr:hypothetical protein [Oscillospiraceae bacterium]